MSQYVAYANYVIYFSDPNDYAFAVLAAGGNQWLHSPQNAAATFGLTYPVPGGALGTKGMYILGQGTSQWDINPPGSIVFHPASSGIRLSPAVDSVLIPGQASPPVSSIPGPDMLLTWCGNIVRVGGTSAGTSPPATAIPQRRFIGGVEIMPRGEGGQGILSVGCRDSSRTIDGVGYCLRGPNSSGVWNRLINEFRSITDITTRDRFYFRWLTLPTTNYRFWRSRGATSSSAGGGIKLTTGGALQFVNIDNVGSETVLSTGAVLTQGQWYLFDVIPKYHSGAANGVFTVLQNHATIFNQTITGGAGLDQAQNLASTEIGDTASLSDATFEADFDDWISSDVPLTLDSYDFFVGSHIRRRYVTGFRPTQSGWTGEAQVANQGTNPDQQIGSTLTSSTSGAVLDGATDYVDDSQDSIGQVLGPVAALMSLESANAGATDGSLGYSAVGGAAVMTTIDQQNVQTFNRVMYLPSGASAPVSITPLRVLHNKSADANLDTVQEMTILTEEIGSWGLEDDPGSIPTPRVQMLHNSRYPNTLWGYVGPVPDGPVSAIGGTYTGNGTTRVVNLPDLCHFIFVRPLSGSTNGWRWFGASLGGHLGIRERVYPHAPTRVFMDSTGQCQFIVTGTDAQVNAVGVTYQYIAFCDPGMRFNLCGAFNHNTNVTNRANTLIDANFTPLAGFAQGEILGSSSSLITLSYKGPGNTGNVGNFLDGTVSSNWGTFAAGIITSRVDLHQSNPAQTNYSLWRTIDGSGDVMVQILSYTGNGAGSQVINLTPVSGRFPLMALVIPTNATEAFYRDPSHTANNSSNAKFDTNSTVAITAG